MSGGDELLGEIIPLVQAVDSADPFAFAILRDKGCIDNRWLFEHELLGCGTALGLGVGLLVNPLEDRGPEAGFAAASGRRAVAEPVGDPLYKARVSHLQITGV